MPYEMAHFIDHLQVWPHEAPLQLLLAPFLHHDAGAHLQLVGPHHECSLTDLRMFLRLKCGVRVYVCVRWTTSYLTYIREYSTMFSQIIEITANTGVTKLPQGIGGFLRSHTDSTTLLYVSIPIIRPTNSDIPYLDQTDP